MLQRLVVAAIKLYRLTLSNLCWGCCRFYPTCSKYTLDAVQQFGVWRGGWLGTKRLLRCHPWCEGGFDPLPTETTPEKFK